jgi:hypothetical protein
MWAGQFEEAKSEEEEMFGVLKKEIKQPLLILFYSHECIHNKKNSINQP